MCACVCVTYNIHLCVLHLFCKQLSALTKLASVQVCSTDKNKQASTSQSPPGPPPPPAFSLDSVCVCVSSLPSVSHCVYVCVCVCVFPPPPPLAFICRPAFSLCMCVTLPRLPLCQSAFSLCVCVCVCSPPPPHLYQSVRVCVPISVYIQFECVSFSPLPTPHPLSVCESVCPSVSLHSVCISPPPPPPHLSVSL